MSWKELGQKFDLIQRQIGDPQSEAVGQGSLLLNGLTGVHLIPRPVREGLAHQVAPVGRGIDRHVGRPALQPALQDGFEHRVGPVILIKGQIVDKQDKLPPPPRQGTDQFRHPAQLFLLHLNEPKILKAGQGKQALHRGRLAGSAVAIEQHVVDQVSLQHGPGVCHHLIPLQLITDHLAGTGAVGLLHRPQSPILP